MNIQIIAAFALYFCTLIGIGFYFYRQNKSATDYMVGGRSVNYWVTAIATQASDMGSWLFLGLPAAVYLRGMPEYWTAIGLIIFMFLTWQYVAPALRVQTGELGSLTLSSYFAQRFPDRATSLRFISAVLTIVFFTFYITSGLVGLGRLFASSFDISYHTGIIISIFGASLYTLVGGFMGVAWCDMLQGIFLLIMIVLVPSYALTLSGGLSNLIASAHAQNVPLNLICCPSDIWSAFLLAASWGLGYFGQPHILVNFMGIDDPNKVHYAKRVGMVWLIIVLSASAAIGLVGLPFFGGSLADPELVFIAMTRTLFHPFFAGLVLCAILAATLSTMDSHILISGTTIAQDMYHKLFGQKASSRALVHASRVGSAIIAAIALFLAWDNTNSVYDLVNYAWAGLGSSFGPLVLAALHSRYVNGSGAVAGMITGGIVAAFWPYLNSGILPLVPGFCASACALYIGTYLTKR